MQGNFKMSASGFRTELSDSDKLRKLAVAIQTARLLLYKHNETKCAEYLEDVLMSTGFADDRGSVR
jgi:hypothetical protein